MRYFSNLPAYERPYTVDVAMAHGYFPSVNINSQGSPNIAPGPALYTADQYVTGNPQRLGQAPESSGMSDTKAILAAFVVGFLVYKILP